MNVTELITTLEYFKEHGNGHLQVFFNDHENGATPMNTITTEESTSPRGIKYLLLNDIPPMTDLTATKEEINNWKDTIAEEEEPTKKKPIEKHIKTIKKPVTIKFKTKKNKIIKIKAIKVTKEKKPHKCFKCRETVEANTGIHEVITGEPHKKLVHKKCAKEEVKFKRKGKSKIQRDFTKYQRRCKGCKQPKPTNQIRYGWCLACRTGEKVK